MVTIAAASGTGTVGGAGRAWRLLTRPAAEWPRIAAEPVSAGQVFRGWIVPFAAIGPLAGLIAGAAYGYRRLGFAYYPSLKHGIAGAVATYLLTLLAAWLLALVIEALARNFKATASRASAMKLVGYGMTAYWVAGVLELIPGAPWLGLLGLYSVYLVWLGLPVVTGTPADRRPPYLAVILIGVALAFLVIALASSSVAGLVAPPMLADAGRTTAVPLTAPSQPAGHGDVAAAAAARAEARAAAAVKRQQAGLPVPTLQQLLPGAVGAFTRRDLGGASGGTSNGTRADASYIADRDSFTLTIADEGPADPVAATLPPSALQTSRQSSNGFERTVTTGGTIVHERWDGSTHAGTYDTRIGNRFTISAMGTVPSLDVLKEAVAAVDRRQLKALGAR